MSVLADSARHRGWIATLHGRHSAWTVTSLGFVALMLLTWLMMAWDSRLLNGVSVWLKPLKFSLSLAVFFGTLAWFAPLTGPRFFSTWPGRLLTTMPIAGAVAEMVYITAQAALGEASHYNTSSPFHEAMYGLMGAVAVVLVTCCLWLGIVVLSRHGWREPYPLAVGIGLFMTFALGGGFGLYLGGQGSHWVGGSATDSDGLPLLRWSRDGGDLRVAHFFGMHAMQIVPLVGFLVPHRRDGLGWLLTAALVYAGLTVFTFTQALAWPARPSSSCRCPKTRSCKRSSLTGSPSTRICAHSNGDGASPTIRRGWPRR